MHAAQQTLCSRRYAAEWPDNVTVPRTAFVVRNYREIRQNEVYIRHNVRVSPSPGALHGSTYGFIELTFGLPQPMCNSDRNAHTWSFPPLDLHDGRVACMRF